MRLPRSSGLDGIVTVVRVRSTTYTFVRGDTQTARFGESAQGSTTDITADAWLFEPEELPLDTEYGDRVGGDLQGLAMPGADIERHDEVQHGTDTYEVSRIIHLPDEDTQRLKLFSLQRITNDR